MSSSPRGFGAETPHVTQRLRRAMELHQSGQLAAAIEIYGSVLEQYPEHPDVLHYLGMAHYKRGDVERARDLMRRSIELDGSRAIVHVNLGRTFLNLHDFPTAATHFGRAVALDPQDWEALHMAARACLGLRQAHDAVHYLEQAIQRRGQWPPLALDLGHAYGAAQRHAEAVEVYERYLATKPGDVEALGGLGFSLRAVHRAADARHALLKATALSPDDPRWWCDLGATEEDLGDFDAAEDRFRHALTLKPNHPIALAHLLALRKGGEDAALVDRALQHVAADEIQKPVRVQLEFALGKHFDGVRDHDSAFEHYRAANDLVEQGRPYDPHVTERQIESLMANFVPELFTAMRPLGHPSERPIFIVGMPRSGTTLAEQLLASHRDIAGAGELGYFNFAAHRFAKARADDSGATYARELDAASLGSCASEYLALLDAASPAARRVVDKMPMNFLQIGLISLTFPNARVIHCRRDPLDTCLSCYFENFQEEQRYATRLESVGHFHRQYERLMRHWRAVAPISTLDLVYEEVVADVETHARRLIEFCGLDWDPSCLDFHRTRRSVNTPSRWQVRQPIYSTSVGRWRHYERHLGPLVAALGRETLPR